MIGERLRAMPRDDFHLLARLLTMSAADFLDEWFEGEALKGSKCTSGIIGTFLGPRSPGTAYVLLHHYMGEIDGAFRAWGFSRGGTGAISMAIAGAAAEAGVEIRTKASIERIKVKDGRAVGVVLEGGDEIEATMPAAIFSPSSSLTPTARLPERSTRSTAAPVRISTPASRAAEAMAAEMAPVPPRASPHERNSPSISPM